MTKNELARLYFAQQPNVQSALMPVIVTAQRLQQLSFSHHLTQCNRDPREQRSSGVTVWVSAVEGGRCAVLSFDWCEIDGGVLCIQNPLAVQSNVYPTSDDGGPLDNAARLRALLLAVYALSWHDRVRDEIPSLKAA